MTDNPVSRRLFLSAAAAAPAAPALLAADSSDRIAIFDPPPSRIRIVTATAASVVGPAMYTAAEVQQIASAGRNVQITMPANAEELNRALPEADVVFGSISPEMLTRAKNLKWLQAVEGGVDSILFPELVKSNVVVTNMARVFGPALGETAIGMLLALTRGIQKYYIPQFTSKQWHQERQLLEIQGLTMGVVGMGGLGSDTAKIAKYGLDMRILATDAKPMAKPIFVDEIHEPGWFMQMLPQSDVVVCTCPWTKDTNGLFNDRAFRAMKKTAYFINLSRGTVADEPALVSALKEGRIAGAGLDVVEPEPYPANGPLWSCPNVIMTQHTGGFSQRRQGRMIAMLVENVRRFSNGLPLMNVVDKVRGY